MIKAGDIYPITTIKYPDHDQDLVVILDKHLKDYTPPYKMGELEFALRGQTRAMEGVYPGDVEGWLNKLPVLD